MSEKGRPKLEHLVVMSIYPGQRKKAGVSRVAIKKTLIEKYGLMDNTRTNNRVRELIKKFVEDGVFENVTAHSFHLGPQGLSMAKEIRKSDAWIDYNDKLEGKTAHTKKTTKATTTKKTSATSTGSKSRTKKPSTPKGKGAIKKETQTRKTKKTAASPKTPSTPKARSKASDSKAGPKTAQTKRRTSPARHRPKRVYYDAVTQGTPGASARARDERRRRAERQAERHAEARRRWAAGRG